MAIRVLMVKHELNSNRKLKFCQPVTALKCLLWCEWCYFAQTSSYCACIMVLPTVTSTIFGEFFNEYHHLHWVKFFFYWQQCLWFWVDENQLQSDKVSCLLCHERQGGTCWDMQQNIWWVFTLFSSKSLHISSSEVKSFNFLSHTHFRQAALAFKDILSDHRKRINHTF
jgi:aminopeptidase C